MQEHRMNLFGTKANFTMAYIKNNSAVMVVSLPLQNEHTFYKDYSSIIAVGQDE